MKIYNPIGSKERLVEMFQQVNKIQLNENVVNSNNVDDIIENSFNELKNDKLKIIQTNRSVTGNQNTVEIVATDDANNKIVFRFKLIGSESDQEDVFSVDSAELYNFIFDAPSGHNFEVQGNTLKPFNAKYENEIADVIGDFVDFGEGEPEVDELYEEAIKLIDKVPYNNGTERLQKHKAYVDEKPTNSNVRVNSPELNSFVKEEDEIEPEDDDPLAMPNDYDDDEIKKDLKNNYDDIDKSYMGTLDVGDTEETTPEEQKLYNQAFENLMAKNKTSKNLNYFPTRPEIEREMVRLKNLNKAQEPEDPDSHMAKGKKRVYPAWADKYLSEVHPFDASDIQNKYYQNISPNVKNEIITMASEILDAELGVKKYQISKQEYYEMIKELAKRIYFRELQMRNESVNESEYPSSLEIPKVIEPKKNYPKEQKKRHKIKKLKVQETEGGFMFENNVDEMSTYRNLNNVDINKHKAVLVHLWSGSPSGVKVAVFVPATNNETNERVWALYPKKPIGFVSYDMVNNPEYAYIEGSAAKEFLKQQGYSIKNDTKTIRRIQEGEENDGMSLEPQIDNIEKLAQDREEQGDQIKGGLGDDKSPLEFEPEQIKLGMKVEMEHTDDPMVALEIALDHLTEDPEYYTVKDDPEASAQANASQEASEDEPHESGAYVQDGMAGEKDRNGHPIPAIDPDFSKMNMELDSEDKELSDTLLGYKPKNVGDVDEEIVGAKGAESVVGGESSTSDSDDEYKKYQDYEKKEFNGLPDNEKEEYFKLWTKYKK